METDSLLSGRGDAPDERTGAQADDPFASDLFVATRASRPTTAASSQTPAPTSQTNAVAWHARLPRLAREQLRLSNALAALPPSLVVGARDVLARVIARYANTAPEQVEIALAGMHESGTPLHRARQISPADSAVRSIWTTLTVEYGGQRAVFVAELDAAFVAALVDRMLGGDGTPPESLRGLSHAERAAVEFLWLAIAREMNELTGATLWRVERLSNDVGAAFADENSSVSLDASGTSGARSTSDAANLNEAESDGVRMPQRYIVVAARIRLASLDGVCRLYLNDAALRALDASRNPLFDAQSHSREARQARLRRIAPDVPLRLLVGETKATAAEVALLKAGDVVIVARPVLEWSGDMFFAERAEVRAGAGRGVLLGGPLNDDVVQAAEDADDGAGATRGRVVARMMLETISSGETAAAVSERVDMEEDDLNGADGESGVALDQLLLTLHVELPARRISLDELGRLRAGQFLDLGCRPTDPVELVADGRRIARGELIDFEGQLGVRITEVNV